MSARPSLLNRLTPGGLRSRLILLTVLAMTPLVALLIVQAESSREQVIAAARTHAASLAQIGAAQENDVIQEVQDVFRVLGRVPEFAHPSTDTSCNAVLAAVERDHPQILFLATTDLGGHIVCASVPAAVGADLSGWGEFRHVVQPHGEAFALTHPEPIAGVRVRQSIAAMAPLPGLGTDPSGVFIAELDLAWFAKLASQIAGNPNNRAVIIDSQTATLLATSSTAAGTSGEQDPTHPALLAFRSNPLGGVVDGAGPDRKACIYGYAPMQTASAGTPHPGAILAVGIDWDGVTRDANRHLLISLCFALLAVLAAVAAAAWLAESSVIRPVKLLTGVARRLSEGELGARADLPRVPVNELRLLGSTLNTMATALERLALTDGLTNVANRRHFSQALEAEVARAIRAGHSVALLMIDADRFKAFNDRYGHAAGDTYLRRIAETLERVPRRPADLVARYGGEEFVVLLPDTNLTGAAELAAKILVAIRDLNLPHEGSPSGNVTVSIGAAACRPRGETDGARLVERADMALYAAKTAGRDRFSVAAPEGDGATAV
jgi:diguanylate cyclase (GGDEF)-like protein